MRRLAWCLAWLLMSFAVPPAILAQPKTVDGVAIDADAELVVALADDTTNMDPRIGMGSIRSNYIRQVFESLVDVPVWSAGCRLSPGVSSSPSSLPGLLESPPENRRAPRQAILPARSLTRRITAWITRQRRR